MEYKFLFDENAGIISISQKFWPSHLNIFLNGEKINPDMEGKYLFKCPDGNLKELKIKRSLWGLDPIPAVFLDGKEIDIARKLNPFEYFMGCLPLLLTSQGVIGGFFGLIMTWINLLLLRRSYGILIRLMLIFLISIVGLFGYMITKQFINSGFTIAQHYLHG